MFMTWKLNRRFVFTLCAGVISGILILSVWMSYHAEASDSVPSHKTRYVTIVAGQTLWNIAEQISKPNEDIRDVVYELSKVNNLSSTNITPGMKLILPTDR